MRPSRKRVIIPEDCLFIPLVTGTQTLMPDVMISYARADAHDFAGRLAAALQNYHIDAWLDTADIEAGAEWKRSIETAIDSCKVFIAVRTPKARDSFWVQNERLYALNQRKPVVPVLPMDCPDDLELIGFQHVDFRHSFENALPQLLTEIEQLRGGKDDRTPDRRALELAYLGKLLLEHSVWQTVYTPMAGVAQVRKEANNSEKPRMVTVPHGIESRFKRRLEQSALLAEHPVEVEERPYSDIIPAVDDLKRLVVLGDPGAGKTTTLWAIAVHAAQEAKDDASKPLPVFVRLGELSKTETLASRIRAQLGGLAPHYEVLLGEKRLLFLLDGLNEMPTENRDTHLRDIQALVTTCQSTNMRAIVTCRELDYAPLDIGIPEKMLITPLDPVRIHRFVKGYITTPAEAGERLFWLLAGEYIERRWQAFSKATGETLDIFWLAMELPQDKYWMGWEHWLQERQQPRSMLRLATNPFILYMITQVFTDEGNCHLTGVSCSDCS